MIAVAIISGPLAGLQAIFLAGAAAIVIAVVVSAIGEWRGRP